MAAVSPDVELDFLALANGRIFINLSRSFAEEINGISSEKMTSVLSEEKPPEVSYGLKINTADSHGQAILSDIFKAIRQNRWITSVNLVVSDGDFDVSAFLWSIEDKTNISRLDLSINIPSNYDDALEYVLGTLRLTSLSMNGPRLTGYMANPLSLNENLKILTIGPGYGDQWDVNFIAAVMRQVPILKISYARNQELNLIGELLKTDSVVEILELKHLRGVVGLRMIGDALKTNTSLKSLTIATNRFIASFDPIFAGLRFNTGLIKLDVRTAYAAGIPSLIEMLRDNTMLEILRIQFNHDGLKYLTREGDYDLDQALENSNLLEISIDNKKKFYERGIAAVRERHHNATQKSASLLKLLL